MNEETLYGKSQEITTQEKNQEMILHKISFVTRAHQTKVRRSLLTTTKLGTRNFECTVTT